MNKVMCISLTMATKIIGALGLALSILMVNTLLSDFFSSDRDNDFIIALESWMMFGLNWTLAVRCLQFEETDYQHFFFIARALLILVLIYALFSFVANLTLALGSLLRKPNYALPWMYLQMVCLIDQLIAVMMQITQAKKYHIEERSVWYIPASIIHLVISGYFWLIIAAARKEWASNNGANYDDNICYQSSSSVRETTTDSNVPKTPSYLSANLALFLETPKPHYYHLPPKYDVV